MKREKIWPRYSVSGCWVKEGGFASQDTKLRSNKEKLKEDGKRWDKGKNKNIVGALALALALGLALAHTYASSVTAVQNRMNQHFRPIPAITQWKLTCSECEMKWDEQRQRDIYIHISIVSQSPWEKFPTETRQNHATSYQSDVNISVLTC